MSKSRKDIKTLDNLYFHTLEDSPFLLSEYISSLWTYLDS